MFRHCYKSYNSVCCPRSRPTVCDNDARTFVTFISSCLCKSSSLNLVVFAPASSAPSKSSPAPLRFTARRSTFAMRLSTTAPLSKNSRPRAPSSLTTSRRFPTVRRLFFQPTAFPAASRTKRMPALCAFSTPRVPWSPKCTVRSSSFTTTARKSS